MRNIVLDIRNRNPEKAAIPAEGLPLIAYSYYRFGLIRLALAKNRENKAPRAA
ncbi:MAG: hypothetical protein ACLFOY_18970 [Desulfatibacillaceae bacterium]